MTSKSVILEVASCYRQHLSTLLELPPLPLLPFPPTPGALNDAMESYFVFLALSCLIRIQDLPCHLT